MVEIKLYFMGDKETTERTLGSFTAGQLDAMCQFLSDRQIECEGGGRWDVREVIFDGGLFPHVAVFCYSA